MWVDRPHRGLGIGARILEQLEAHAGALGHRSVRLYTNRSLDEAKAMYRAHGYVEIARYNDDPTRTTGSRSGWGEALWRIRVAGCEHAKDLHAWTMSA